MLNCGFFGQTKVYDDNLQQMLMSQVHEIIEQTHECLNFYFTAQDDFNIACFNAVRRVREEKPDEIKLTFVDYTRPDYGFTAPPVVRMENYDEVLLPCSDHTYDNSIYSAKRVIRWVIKESDYLFLYNYGFYNIERRVAMNIAKASAKKIDLTNASTEIAIEKHIDGLPEKQRYVLQQLENGFKKAEIAAQLGLSGTRIDAIRCAAKKSLNEKMEKVVFRGV